MDETSLSLTFLILQSVVMLVGIYFASKYAGNANAAYEKTNKIAKEGLELQRASVFLSHQTQYIDTGEELRTLSSTLLELALRGTSNSVTVSSVFERLRELRGRLTVLKVKLLGVGADHLVRTSIGNLDSLVVGYIGSESDADPHACRVRHCEQLRQELEHLEATWSSQSERRLTQLASSYRG